MMILERKERERIVIGDGVIVEVVSIGRSKVRLGITAPRQIEVDRAEVRQEKLERANK